MAGTSDNNIFTGGKLHPNASASVTYEISRRGTDKEQVFIYAEFNKPGDYSYSTGGFTRMFPDGTKIVDPIPQAHTDALDRGFALAAKVMQECHFPPVQGTPRGGSSNTTANPPR